MVTIDKTQTSTELIFTLTECATIANPFYLLVLDSPFTNKTFRFALPENTSIFKDRYDKFVFDISTFSEMEAGTYYYSIYESSTESLNEKTMGYPIETGLLKVVGTEAAEPISITPAETDDDYITYDPT